MFWPEYTSATQQYLHITRNMTSHSIKSYLLAREYNMWHDIIPALYKELQEVGKRVWETHFRSANGLINLTSVHVTESVRMSFQEFCFAKCTYIHLVKVFRKATIAPLSQLTDMTIHTRIFFSFKENKPHYLASPVNPSGHVVWV